MPKLRREEENRQQTRVGGATGAIMGVLIAVSGLSVFALQSRNQAFRSLEDSMFATGRMVLLAKDIANGGDDSAATIRNLLINQGCDLIDNLSTGSGVDPAIAELVTCKLERAFDRESHGEQAEAQKEFEASIHSASARYGRVPRSDAADRLLEAQQAYAEYFVRQKDDGAATREYTKLLEQARAFVNADSFRAEYTRAEGEALGSLGDLYVKRGDRTMAGGSYDEAAVCVRQEINLEGDKPTVQNIEWLARLYRLAGEQHRRSNDAVGAIDRYNKALGVRSLVPDNTVIPELDQEEAMTHSLIFLVEQARGSAEAAEKARQDALVAVDLVHKARSISTELDKRATELKHWLEEQKASN
jgi:tetratricopeptide (TPR) repeat protein